MNDPSDGDSPGNFIEITNRRGRCRICDFHYSKDDPDEARQHRSYHRRYLQACDDLSAPIHRAEREQMMKEGGEMLKHGSDFPERVRGAEHQLEALFHEHLAAVLGGSEPRRSFSEFLTDLDISGGLDSRYEKDVADELRHLHSGSAAEVSGLSQAPVGEDGLQLA
jgi:hypothetical protein